MRETFRRHHNYLYIYIYFECVHRERALVWLLILAPEINNKAQVACKPSGG